MTGSQHTHRTLSELQNINWEQDRQLHNGIAASSSSFSVYAAVLSALQRRFAAQTSTHATVTPEPLSNRIRGIGQSRSIVTGSQGFCNRGFGQLVLAGSFALRGLSIGARKENSAWQEVGNDEGSPYASGISVNRRNKQLAKHYLIKKINYQKKITKENLFILNKQYKKYKKLLGKKSSKTLTGKNKIINIICQIKKEKEATKKNLAMLDKKCKKTKKSLTHLLSRKYHDSNKVRRLLKSIRQREKINKKNHLKLKNHRIIKTLLHKAKQHELSQKKSPKNRVTLCLAKPLNGDHQERAYKLTNSVMTTQGKKPLRLKGGGASGEESGGGLVGSLTRGVVRTLAAQASTTDPSVTFPLFSSGEGNTRVDPTQVATSQKDVITAVPYRGTDLDNQQIPVVTLPNSGAHDLAYSAYKPKNTVADEGVGTGNSSHREKQALKVTQSSQTDTVLVTTTQNINTGVKKENIQKIPEINYIIGKKCKAMADFLIDNKFVSQDENYEVHPEFLIHGAIQFTKHVKKGKAILAEILQKVQEKYTEKTEKPFSEAHQDSIVNHWISQLMFKKNADEFIVELFVILERIHQSSYGTPAENIIDRFRNIKIKTENFIDKKLTGSNQHEYVMMDTKKYIIDNIIEPLIPAINKNIKGSIKFFEFGYINAGYQLDSLYTNNTTITADEALALGKMIYIQHSEGVVDYQFIKKFFSIMALFNYAANNIDMMHQYFSNIKSKVEVEKKALDYYFHEVEKYNQQEDDKNKAISEAVSTLNELIKNYKTRTQLSDDILKKNCPSKDQTQHLNGDNFCVTGINYPVLPAMGPIRHFGFKIESATEKFYKQIKEVLNQISKVHHLVFNNLFEKLSNEDNRFIKESEIKELTVYLIITEKIIYVDRPATYGRSASYGYGYRKFGYSENDFPAIYQMFVANNNGRKKYFLIKIENDEYSIIKINNTIEDYYPLLKIKKPFNKEKYNYLEIHEGDVLKNPGESLIKLTDGIFNKKEEKLKKQLNDEGYDKTFLEKFKDFLPSLIPFRDSVNLFKEGKIRAGIASGVLDIFSIIPVVAVGSRALLASAKIVRKVGSKTLLDLSVSGARNSLKKSMGIVGRNAIDMASKLGVVAKKNSMPFVKELIREVDPGVELVVDITRSSIKKLLVLGRYMQDNIPNLKNALDKIENKPITHGAGQSLENFHDNLNMKFSRPSSKITLAHKNKIILESKTNLRHQWGNSEFSKIDGLNFYNIKLENLRHRKILNRHFIYDANDKNKVLEIKNTNNKFHTEATTCVHTDARAKRGANCAKGSTVLQGSEKVNEIKNMISSSEEIKVNYGIKDSEACEKMAKLVRGKLIADKNLLLETRGIALWGDIEGKKYENHFVVKATLKETGEIFIIDVTNGIVASEMKWISIFLKKNKEKDVFIQYADFKSTETAMIEIPVFSPNTPLLNNGIIIKEPAWYYKSLKNCNDYPFNNYFYERKLKLNNECLKNDLMMSSSHGLDINKNIYLNSAWFLEKLNIKSKPYVDGTSLGSEISVSFYLDYKNKEGADFVEIPQLRWDEQIKANSANQGNWKFPTTNMYEHNFPSLTFYPWRNRYNIAYEFVMTKKNPGEIFSVQLMNKNGKKINTNKFLRVSSAEEKTQQVIDYLKNNGGKIKITIQDRPRVALKKSPYERKVDFSIGFENNKELATFTQGFIDNNNAERVAFITTSKDVLVAELFDPKAIVPESVSKIREKIMLPGERE